MIADLTIRAQRRNVVETRSTAFRDVDLLSTPDGTGGENLKFRGYASVTESPYEMSDWLGDYTETIRRGAFSKTLSDGADVPFKVNHDGVSLARTKSGTMRLAEDSIGLHVEADLDPRSPAVQTLRSAMERGDLDEMSFGFRVMRQDWSTDYTERSITEVSLHKGDVSVVNFGANPATGGLTSLRARYPDEIFDLTPLERAREFVRRMEELESSQSPASPADLSLYSARIRALSFSS